MSLDPYSIAVLALLPSVLFLAWFLRAAGKAPEPPHVVAALYVAGCAAFGAAVLVLKLLEPVLSAWPGQVRMFLGVATVEESLKLCAILLAAGLPTRWGRMTSGLVYAVAASLGFAALENIVYAERFGVETGLLRAVTAVPGHAMHGALVGIQLGRANGATTRRSAVSGVLLGLFLAVVAHGLYNSLLLEGPTVRMFVVPLLALEAAVLLAMLRRAKAEDIDHVVGLLAELPILKGAPISSLRMLATRALRRRLAAGDQVFREGDLSRAVYLVLGGKMSVDQKSQDPADRGAPKQLAQLGKGAYFGEMGVLMDQRRSASVTAESDGLVLELSQSGLYEAFGAVDGFAEELRDVAQSRGAAQNLPTVTGLHRLANLRQDRQEAELEPDSLVGRLHAIPLFAGLRIEAVQLLAAGAFTESRRKRAVLIREGSSNRGLCVLLDGTARVYRQGERVAELGPGDWFGEIGLLTGYAATATVRASSAVEFAVVDAQGLRDVIGVMPTLGRQLLDEIGKRLGQSTLPIDERRPARGRLAAALKRRVASFGFARAEAQTDTARQLLAAFPELLELPAGAAEALAEVGAPVDGPVDGGVLLVPKHPDHLGGAAWLVPDDRLNDALSRSPHLLHVFARATVRRVIEATRPAATGPST